MTTKERINTHTPLVLKFNKEKQLDLASLIVKISMENAFGKRNSPEVNLMKERAKTFFKRTLNEKAKNSALEQAIYSGINFREAKKQRKQGKLRGWEVRDRNNEAAAAVDRLFSVVKVARNI